ncbi:hypothetical protein MBANPS3_010500 [Mucor bainieri]
MDFTYPHLFDIVDETTFDADLFHGLHHPQQQQQQQQQQQDVLEQHIKKQHYSSSSSPSYLHYLQSTTTTTTNNNNNIPTNTNNSFFYDAMHPLNLDLVDYDYTFQQPQCALDQKQQQQQYNWLYDPIDTYLPQQNSLFCDETMMSHIMTSNSNQHHQHQPSQFDCIMSENDMEDSITVEGGMSRGYVSLSDVNSFVAKADSAKQQHACLLQLSSLQENLLLDDFSLKPPSHHQQHQKQQQSRDFMSSSESTNDDSEDDYSDNNSDIDLRWNALMSSYGVPAMHVSTPSAVGAAAMASSAHHVTNNNNNNTNEKLMIKIKKPRHGMSTPMNSALPSPYGEHHHHPWDLVSPKTSKSAGTSSSSSSSSCSYSKSSSKYRKSMSNIYSATTGAGASSGKKKASKFDPKGRRGSAPHRLTIHNNTSASSMGSLHSSSSLSSLSNNLQRSMRVSESIHSLLSDDDEAAASAAAAADHELEEEHEHLLEEDEEDEDDDDDEYQIRAPNASSHHHHHGQLPTKKGRNVDKACNHCKRSHLRCDDMRPCRRCVATGKQGCKDVQHKPRGRPKLHKKLTK